MNAETSIALLPFAGSVINALWEAGYRTLNDLAGEKYETVRALPNIGTGSISKIDKQLKASGLEKIGQGYFRHQKIKADICAVKRRAELSTIYDRLIEHGLKSKEAAKIIGLSRERLYQMRQRTVKEAEVDVALPTSEPTIPAAQPP